MTFGLGVHVDADAAAAWGMRSRLIYVQSDKTRVKSDLRRSATDPAVGQRVRHSIMARPCSLITISTCRAVHVGKRWNRKSTDCVNVARRTTSTDPTTARDVTDVHQFITTSDGSPTLGPSFPHWLPTAVVYSVVWYARATHPHSFQGS